MYNLIINIIKKYKLQEFIRFVLVGVLATLINYGVYYPLVISDINKNIAYTIAYIISFCFNFFATNLFTFKTKANAENGIRFALAHLTNYTIQLILLNLFSYFIPEKYAPLPVYFLAIPINFFVVRFALRFKKNKNTL